MKRAQIITIGDELLIGQVINTNQAYVASRLNDIGITVEEMTTVGDAPAPILSAFKRAWENYDIVIVTGGLGPTHDDITKKSVCTFFDTDLVERPAVRAQIEALLHKRKGVWGPSAEEQVMIPRKAEVIPNPVGTAAGMLFREEGKSFIVLPGVPYEMKEIMEQSVVPLLSASVTAGAIRHLTLRTSGAPESTLATLIGDVQPLLDGGTLAFLPSLRGVRLRISVYESDASAAEEKIHRVGERIRARVEKYVYGTGEEEIEDVIGRLLTERHLTLAVAESCTGGLVADRITNVPGSSVYFERGLVTYSNRSKIELLQVPQDVLEKHGAVSGEVAESMALGARRVAGTDIGLSTTGIAGPTGGTPEKPVGLVWFGYADAEKSFARRFMYGEGRLRVKERASQTALDLLWRQLTGKE